jgi:hypothetical protein
MVVVITFEDLKIAGIHRKYWKGEVLGRVAVFLNSVS